MYGNNGFVDVGYAFIQAADDSGELKWHGVAHGVRNVDGGGTGINRRFDHSRQIGNWGASGIFARKFNIIGVITGAFHHIDSAFDHLVQRAAQLGGDVHWRSGNKGMNTEGFGDFQGFGCHVDIFFHAAS